MTSRKSAPKLNHPFLNGLKELPDGRTRDLGEIRSWMESQPHLPNVSDEYIYLFLHACFYDHAKTKHAIETYFTIRANTPSLFGDRDVYSDSMEFISKLACLFKLPEKTPEGYTVIMVLAHERATTDYIFSDLLKGFMIFNDCVISEVGLAEGYVVIFDMKNIKLGHFARITLPALRAFMTYIQEAHPARLKAIHIINTASFIKQAMRIITPLIRSELVGLLRFHQKNVPDGIPLELLPKDFGGDAPHSLELGNELYRLRDVYAAWIAETEHFVADESKRAKKTGWWSFFSGGMSNNNSDIEFKGRRLEVD